MILLTLLIAKGLICQTETVLVILCCSLYGLGRVLYPRFSKSSERQVFMLYYSMKQPFFGDHPYLETTTVLSDIYAYIHTSYVHIYKYRGLLQGRFTFVYIQYLKTIYCKKSAG